MMILALLSWWYTAGWARLAGRIGGRINAMLETFSVGLLARTLFDPFRQISASQVRGGFDAQVRAFGDRLFSRFFGAFVRTLFIVLGLAAAFLVALVGILQLILWPFIPVLPAIGAAAAVTGWTP